MGRQILVLFLFLNLFSCDSVDKSGQQTTNDREYLTTRNNYIRHFKNLVGKIVDDKLYEQDTDSLLVLEKKLRDILEGSRINNITQDGKINLKTLIDGMGFGMLDGLMVNKDSLRIFCTSKYLFNEYFNQYFEKNKINKFDYRAIKNIEDIFNSVFYSDAHITNFTSIKTPVQNNIQGSGFVGVVAQCEGLFLPEYLYIFFVDDNFIYMTEERLKQPLRQIPKCKSIWDSTYLKAQEFFEIYRASKLNDTTAIHKQFQLEQLAWDKYCNCFQNELKYDNQFNSIMTQTNKTFQYILQSDK